jgi:hypothetical protein
MSRRRRWKDFRRRATFAPDRVYRHHANGWEYIPIHPFGDELVNLARLKIQPNDCRSVDAWWGIDEDATLLESVVASQSPNRSAGLYARATTDPKRWVYLLALIEAPHITRVAFEEAMNRFVQFGFPRNEKLRPDIPDRYIRVG